MSKFYKCIFLTSIISIVIGTNVFAFPSSVKRHSHPGVMSVLRTRPRVPSDFLSKFNFTASTGSFNSITSTGDTIPEVFDYDEGVSVALPIGFAFYFGGNPYSYVFASSNGWLSFNPLSRNDSLYKYADTLADADTRMLPFITPLDADLIVNNHIYYETDGSAPNRIFTVEWSQVVGYGNSVGPNATDQLSFQVKLYETTGEIQFIYQPGPDSSVAFDAYDTGTSIGLVDSLGEFISLSGMSTSATASSVTEIDSVKTPPSDGLTFSFVPTDHSLSVQATDFVATTDVGSVMISWKTQSEVGNAGFNILREDPNTSTFKLISSYTSNDSLRGLGTSSTGRSYDFTDYHVVSGSTFQYKIQSVSTGGVTKDLSTLSATVDVPNACALYQNYPNPFNPTTTIQFDLKAQSTVTLDIYNVLGQRVFENNYGTMNAGRFTKVVNMDMFASGMYFYRIVAIGNNGEKFVSMKKFVLMK
ncbi:MAG TPA: T9SS type A sorting domain-containing protein [Candidatus Acidoferrales bacterium]|nr:T9SS type A sorting domain-containing protein [Candidatus Acidoferrales bacterium]